MLTNRNFPINLRIILLGYLLLTCCISQNDKSGKEASGVVPPIKKSLALKPPMGWNSWDCLGFDVNEAEVKATADFMAKEIRQLGYEYIVLDMNWYAPDYNTIKGTQAESYRIDKYGRLLPDTIKFPSSAGGMGFKPLADYIHSLGLKFGIHILGGVPVKAFNMNCLVKGTNISSASIIQSERGGYWHEAYRGIDISKPGGQEYYNSIFELYASWGVDYIKADYLPFATDLVGISRASRTCGRDMIISAVPDRFPESLLKENAHMARIGIDLWDQWEWLKRTFFMAAIMVKEIEPGYWPDLDMLPAGMLTVKSPRQGTSPHISNFTKDELYTLFSLWYITRSPLLLGGYLPQTEPFTLDLILNEEALQVNRNSVNNRQIYQFETKYIVWTADISDSKGRYLGFFNISDDNPQTISATWDQLGLLGKNYKIRDLWSQKDLGSFSEKFEAVIPPHGVGLYKVSE